MDWLGCLLVIICRFFINAAGIVFLHCFYDTAFLWNKKKCLLFVTGAAIQLVLLLVFPNETIVAIIHFLFTISYGILAIYDYQGKKFSGFLRFNLYSLPAQILITCSAFLIQLCLSPKWIEFVQRVYSVDDIEAFLSQHSESELLSLAEETISSSPSDIIIINIIGIIFFASAFLLLYPLYKKGVVMRCGKWVTIVTILVAVLNYLLYLIATEALYGKNFMAILIPLAVYAVCFAFLFPIFLYSSLIGEFYRKRTAFQELHIQAELAHFQQYRQAQEETSRFRHDIRNNLLCVNDMLQQGKFDDASVYLKDLLEIVENTSRKYVTGDDLLDSIVGVKTQIMDQHGIRFELDGVLAGGLSWKPTDICNVFANALDNAIEACQKVDPEKRQISMSIKSTSQFWFVNIENPVSKKVDTSKLFQKNGGYTSKSNSAQHGIGTYNMKYTVESYGAMIKAECTEEIFRLEIMLDKSSPE